MNECFSELVVVVVVVVIRTDNTSRSLFNSLSWRGRKEINQSLVNYYCYNCFDLRKTKTNNLKKKRIYNRIDTFIKEHLYLIKEGVTIEAEIF